MTVICYIIIVCTFFLRCYQNTKDRWRQTLITQNSLIWSILWFLLNCNAFYLSTSGNLTDEFVYEYFKKRFFKEVSYIFFKRYTNVIWGSFRSSSTLLGSKGSGMSTIPGKIFSLHPFFHFNPSFQIITMYCEWKGFINLYTYKLFDGMVTVDGDLLRTFVMLYINHDRITTKDCLSFLFIKRILQVWMSILGRLI